jgi:acyl-CoA reductase-like NAD-dependent aldehyde dehydrogenase
MGRHMTMLPGLQAGMTSINDFATTYMCQSLPFGGVKHSGFDRFAGIEGLRGMTVPKAVAEDR